MRRLVLAFAFSFLLVCGNSVSASVKEHHQTAENYDIKYPVVEANNVAASTYINSDIGNYVARFITSYENGKFVDGKIMYRVKYEDDTVISLKLRTSKTFHRP